MYPTVTMPKVRARGFSFQKKETVEKQSPALMKARSSILNFTTHTMPAYDVNWHHEEICYYLDRFVSGEIKRLMVFMPPRHGKSELVSRRLPAYILGKTPNSRIIATSYGADLSRRMNRDVQRIIDSKRYKDVFPNTNLFGKNIRTVAGGTWLRNSDMFEVVDHEGYYRSAGVGGAIGGMGMNYGIIDDPYKNRQDANSPTVRRNIWDWYVGTFRDRLAPNGGICLVTTLWSEMGLAYELLKRAKDTDNADKWVVLRFPARFDNRHPKVMQGSIVGNDQRTEIGQPLWENRFDEKALRATRDSIGSYEWNSKFQQDPAPREGNMFKRAWFTIVSTLPAGCRFVRYWDKAGTQDGGDYTAGVLMAENAGIFYVVDLVMGQWSYGERENVIKQTAIIDRQRYGHYLGYVEQEGGSGGKESAESTIRNLAGFSFRADRPTGNKELRAEPFAAQSEAGNVRLLEGDWNGRYLDILTSFPVGIKDPVDASSGAFNKLAIPFSTESTEIQVPAGNYKTSIKDYRSKRNGNNGRTNSRKTGRRN